MPESKHDDHKKPTPATSPPEASLSANPCPNQLTEIFIKLYDHHRATHDALEQSSLREAAIDAQKDPYIGVKKDSRLEPEQKGLPAPEKSKARKRLRQFASGELSEAELRKDAQPVHNLLSRHYTRQEAPMTPWDFAMREIKIQKVSLDTRALREYLGLLGIALKQGRDASRLELSKAAERVDITIAQLNLDEAFMKKLIGGLWEKCPADCKAAGLSRMTEEVIPNSKATSTKPPADAPAEESAEDQQDSNGSAARTLEQLKRRVDDQEQKPESAALRVGNMSEQIDMSQPLLTAKEADSAFLDAVRRIVPEWDGKNMEVPEELLRSLDLRPEEIKNMSMFKITMKITMNEKKLRAIFVTPPPQGPKDPPPTPRTDVQTGDTWRPEDWAPVGNAGAIQEAPPPLATPEIQGEWPPDDKLHWRPFKVAHCGKICDTITRTQFGLLKAVFESPDSVSFEALKETVWHEKEVGEGTFRTTLSTAKTALREAGLGILADALSTKGAHAELNRALLLNLRQEN